MALNEAKLDEMINAAEEHVSFLETTLSKLQKKVDSKQKSLDMESLEHKISLFNQQLKELEAEISNHYNERESTIRHINHLKGKINSKNSS